MHVDSGSGEVDAPAAAVGGAAAPASGIDKSKLSLLRRKLVRFIVGGDAALESIRKVLWERYTALHNVFLWYAAATPAWWQR